VDEVKRAVFSNASDCKWQAESTGEEQGKTKWHKAKEQEYKCVCAQTGYE